MLFNDRRDATFILLFLLPLLAVVLGACAEQVSLPAIATPAEPEESVVEGVAAVETVELQIEDSLPVQVRVVVRGALPDSCTELSEAGIVRRDDAFIVTVKTTRPADAVCLSQMQPFEQIIPLPVEGAPAGVYRVSVNGVSASFELGADNAVALETPPGLAETIAPTTRPDASAPAETPTPSPPSPTPQACKNKAAFVRDVTVKDDAIMPPGQTFVKTWRLLNEGTCTWTPAYALTFVSGDAMSAPDIAPLTRETPPGKTVDVSVTLVAPITKGVYQGFWKLRAPSGKTFGIGEKGKAPFWVKIRVTKSVTPTPSPIGSNISGRVWHDLCKAPSEGGPRPPSPPAGCVLDAEGGYRGDGVFDEGEPVIAGYEVNLGLGPCPSTGFSKAIADAQGVYIFRNLEAGTYCVSIDPLSDYNLPIFIPGQWTYPPNGRGEQTVTVDGIEDLTAVDFGWDYQFAP
ncbi:MAG: hypothetical protein GXP42_14020 [Chloroflexi bacterium]|nr:hypothetical protein [Chloroflexota bacterium]